MVFILFHRDIPGREVIEYFTPEPYITRTPHYYMRTVVRGYIHKTELGYAAY